LRELSQIISELLLLSS